MNISRKSKNWKAAEIQLRQAADFLHNPNAFQIEECPVESYKNKTRENELIAACFVWED